MSLALTLTQQQVVGGLVKGCVLVYSGAIQLDDVGVLERTQCLQLKCVVHTIHLADSYTHS